MHVCEPLCWTLCLCARVHVSLSLSLSLYISLSLSISLFLSLYIYIYFFFFVSHTREFLHVANAPAFIWPTRMCSSLLQGHPQVAGPVAQSS